MNGLPSHRIRLIATDLDGTLLGHDRVPVAESADALRRAREAGIEVTLATGRLYASAKSIADSIDLDASFVCSNGGHGVLSDEQEVLYMTLAPEPRAHLVQYARRSGCALVGYSRQGIFFYRDSSWTDLYLTRLKTIQPTYVTLDQLGEMQLLKMLIVDDPEMIPKHRAALEQDVVELGATVTESEPEYLEFLPRNANKATGLKAVCQALGIEVHEVAAIGDYLNDVEMLQWAGFSGAVANANPEILPGVDVVVKSNVEGGVAEFVDRYVLQR